MGDKVLCPQCGKVMVRRERRSDGKPFWGCSGYPTCRKAVDINDAAKNGLVVSKKEFVPSIYQQAIFDYIQDKDGQDAVIEAVAGSGKTTTIIEALKYTSGKVAFVAFNKRIADELKTRAPAHVKCCTLHSMVGYERGMMRPIAIIGDRDYGEAMVYVLFSTGRKPLKHIVKHSPDGMNWGYLGSGPSDTALSILTYALRSQAKAEKYYQDFKFEYVAKWTAKAFFITLWEIRNWYKERMEGINSPLV